MRCAIYARYSSDQQSPLSIADQVRVCREYAEARGWEILESFADEAISGAGVDRPALAALLDRALAPGRAFDVILVDDTSRLSRRLADAVGIFDRLHFAGVRIVAVSQGIDSSSDQADVLVTVHGLVDSLYIKELARKTHRGLEGSILRGGHAGGRCFGYRTQAGATLVIDDAEAQTVRRIFEMSAEGGSLTGIATALNKAGIGTSRPTAKKHFASWCPSAIRAMLHNELYAGRLIWNRSRFVKHPGTNKRQRRPRPRSEWRVMDRPELRIVSDELWNRVHQRLAAIKEVFAKRGVGLSRSASSPYLFSGLLRCGVCGASMSVVAGNPQSGQYYGCPQQSKRGTCANKLRIRRDRLETGILGELQASVLHPEIIEFAIAELSRQMRERSSTLSAELSAARSRQAELRAEIDRLTAAVAEAGHTRPLLSAIAERERELVEISDRLLAPAGAIERSIGDLRDFVTTRLADLARLLSADVPRARAVLLQHMEPVRLVPTSGVDGKLHYVAEGKWKLLGGYQLEGVAGGRNAFKPTIPYYKTFQAA